MKRLVVQSLLFVSMILVAICSYAEGLYNWLPVDYSRLSVASNDYVLTFMHFAGGRIREEMGRFKVIYRGQKEHKIVERYLQEIQTTPSYSQRTFDFAMYVGRADYNYDNEFVYIPLGFGMFYPEVCDGHLDYINDTVVKRKIGWDVAPNTTERVPWICPWLASPILIEKNNTLIWQHTLLE